MTITAPPLADLSSVPVEEVLLRRHALARGITDEMLRQGLRRGDLTRIRQGAYVPSSVWSAQDERGRHALRARAVHLTHEEVGVLSHTTAAALHGLDLWEVPLDIVHLTRLDQSSGRRLRDLTYHQGELDDAVTAILGMPVVGPARAALESSTLLDAERALVVVDSGLRCGLFDRAALEEQGARMTGWPHTLNHHVVLRLADGRHESAGESRTAYQIWKAGLPMPTPQVPVYDGDELVAVVDMLWDAEGVALEFDGRIKYERFLRPGERPGDAVAREKRREDRVRELTGWIVIRVVWADLRDPARLAARIRRALARSRAV